MKKLVTAACALAAGLALADGVVSSNIVGYTEIVAPKQYNILGINYISVDGGDLSIQDAFPYVEGMTAANNAGDADQIQIANAAGTGYDTYFMGNGKTGKGKDAPELYHKWVSGTKAATVKMPAGTAFWFVRKNYDTPLTNKVAGGVSLLASSASPINKSYTLIANPYPTDLPLNDGVPYVEGMTAANNAGDADQIQIANAAGTGYDTYFMGNGKTGKGKDAPELYHKWVSGTKAATASIPAGSGAWYVRKADVDVALTIPRPFNISE